MTRALNIALVAYLCTQACSQYYGILDLVHLTVKWSASGVYDRFWSAVRFKWNSKRKISRRV
jgi:hypothetical protein